MNSLKYKQIKFINTQYIMIQENIVTLGIKEYSTSLEDLADEKWLDVIGYDGYYQISNMGRLKSLEREIPNARGSGYRTLREKIKKIDVHKKRNQVECLYSVGAENKSYNFAKQIALHFINNYNNETIYHIDGNVSNCKVSNLIKVTKQNVLGLYSNKNIVPPNPISELLHEMGYKKCCVCKDIKEFVNFSKSYRNRGVNNNCKKCSNKNYIHKSKTTK